MNKTKSFLRKIPNLTPVLAYMNVFILLKSNVQFVSNYITFFYILNEISQLPVPPILQEVF